MKQATHKSISVMLVDDHPVVRDGYRHLLETEPDISVVAEASNGETCCSEYKKYTPDVVVLDLSMPGIGGLELLARSRETAPETVFVVITAYATLEAAIEATKLGVMTVQ